MAWSAAKWTTYNGHKYPSKAEALRAEQLDFMVRGNEIDKWAGQVWVELVPGFRAQMDFEVWEKGVRRFEEVKGRKSKRWRDISNLWKHHGPCVLRVLERNGDQWKTTRIVPERDDG